MCGIAGIYDFKGRRVNPEDLDIFVKSLHHRGPDDDGIWYQNNVGLAHTRLSIIDISPMGHQPMSNEDGTIWITFNGEIYNFMDLREGLQDHRFKGNSDTEVIVHLYEEKGISCLEYLRGMFAFALWDAKKRRLFLARDRIGKKPLFYTIQNDCLVFASELKAISALTWIDDQIDLTSLAYAFSYDHVPWPKSICKNILKLPPSSYAVFDDEHRGVIRKYWELDLQRKLSLSEDEAAERLLGIMRESVRLRLRSDVPLGMFLSGGLDSSLVVGLASQCVDQPIRTFSIGYQGQGTKDPEFYFSKQVSSRFNTIHREILFDKELIQDLPELMFKYDEPFCIPNALAHYQLCKETRKDVTVSLSGDGADEIFAGYDVYKKWKLLDWCSFVIPWRNSDNCRYGGNIANLKGFPPLKLFLTPRAFRRGTEKQLSFLAMAGPVFNHDAWNALKTVNVGKHLSELYLERNPKQFLDGVLYGDLFLNYAWSTTIASDISGMANSLEVRSPFLDHKVVEFAFSLPVKLKLKLFNQEKFILYKAGSTFLPEVVVNRKKMSYGAGIPYKRWFFNEWMPVVKEIIFDEKVTTRNLFNMAYVERLLNNPECDSRTFKLLWRILCTCAWMHN